MLDELRRRDWATRSLRRLERDLADARRSFTAVHQRPPTPVELADMVNMTPSELRENECEIANSDVTSLSSLVLTDGATAIELVETLEAEDVTTDPEQVAAHRQAKERFRVAFEKLSPREREIAILLYVKDLTLREVGEVMGVSESRISQVHKELKRRIRDLLESESTLFTEAA